MQSITYLKNNEINRQKWDVCIKNAFNAEITAFSWFLDSVCDNWDALVWGDYFRVMPIPYKREKNGLKIRQPILTRHICIYSPTPYPKEIVTAFINSIPHKFSIKRIYFSPYTPSSVDNLKETESIKEIDLISPFETLHNKYTDTANLRIKTAKKAGIKKGNPCNLPEFIYLLQKHLKKYPNTFKSSDIKKISIIISSALRYGLGEIISTYTKEGKLCSSAFFLSYTNQAVMMLCPSNSFGRTNFASYLIIDEYLKKHSHKNKQTLSFYMNHPKGYDIIAEHFGAQPVSYFSYKTHSTPLWRRVFS